MSHLHPDPRFAHPSLARHISNAPDPEPDGLCHCAPSPTPSAIGECPSCRRLVLGGAA